MPFGPYEDFDDCVSKNSDKDDAAAFCSVLEDRLKDQAGADEVPFAGMRMKIVSYEQLAYKDDEDKMEVEQDVSEDFHAVLVVEGAWTGDGRYIEEMALDWRDLPLPLMATDETSEGHMGAVLVGNITRIEREGRMLHGYGSFLVEPDERAGKMIGLVQRGELRGISVDMDAVEFEIVMVEPDEAAEERLGMPSDQMVITQARLMGATVVPFPAFQEAFIESTASLTAALQQWVDLDGVVEPIVKLDPITASGFPVKAPLCPSSEWFANPALTHPTPMTVTDNGQIYGHLATWDTCHVGYVDSCVRPPRSPAEYGHFMTGEIVCSDGSRVNVGQITMDTRHAPLNANGARAAAHYDDTGLAVADVRCGEDAFGIWMAGALRPDVAPEKIRGLMASDVSGDWRRIGSSLELVGVLAVNVPGFPKIRESAGLVASMVASLTPKDESHSESLVKVADRIAASIGLSKKDRIDALAAKVSKKS